MSRADYAHWNEDQDYMWWHEEGKHEDREPEPSYEDGVMDWLDDFAEACAEDDMEHLRELLSDVRTTATMRDIISNEILGRTG